MEELGVSIIPACSPQAKGRIEWLWGVLQDRDVFHVCGFMESGAQDAVKRIVLSQAAGWARRCADSLRTLLKQQHVRVFSGET
jgi:hypothetical protein